MKGPSYTVQANRIDQDESTHQRNPSWCIAIVRFQEPAAAYTDQPNEVKPLLIIENDCTSVSVQNDKASFGKSCSLSLRAGEVFYPGAVACGDWVAVWMSDYQEDIDKTIASLNNLKKTGRVGSTSLNDWNSGLKFVGRVTSVGTSDHVSPNGLRQYTQSITAQSFLEFAASIYYTETAQAILTRQVSTLEAHGVATQNGLQFALHGLANKFIDFFTNSSTSLKQHPPPDQALAFYLTVALGIDRKDALLKKRLVNTEGVISDATEIPPIIATMLGKPNARKLWQLLNVYIGVQQYKNRGKEHWVNFAPAATVFPDSHEPGNPPPTFFKTSVNMKGWVPYFPVPWDNQPLWTILNQYLNAPLNELYTVLRIDQFGRITPSVVAREKPFGTALFGKLNDRTITGIKQDTTGTQPARHTSRTVESKTQKSKVFVGSISFDRPNEEVRAMYDTHPRWVIDETMIHSVDVGTYENNRVNFVQVWGRNALSQAYSPSGSQGAASADTDRSNQLAKGNMVADEADIRRNGLRANVVESPFDYPLSGGTRVGYWSKLRADWLFNGHLKAQGSINANGIKEPICEGDNAEVRGVVYHINGVSHQGSIAPSGQKVFTTTLQVFNGILAESLNAGRVPTYIFHQGSNADDQVYIPGTTDIQVTSKRDADGERNRGEQG